MPAWLFWWGAWVYLLLALQLTLLLTGHEPSLPWQFVLLGVSLVNMAGTVWVAWRVRRCW